MKWTHRNAARCCLTARETAIEAGPFSRTTANRPQQRECDFEKMTLVLLWPPPRAYAYLQWRTTSYRVIVSLSNDPQSGCLDGLGTKLRGECGASIDIADTTYV
jgi:hypothetical protein